MRFDKFGFAALGNSIHQTDSAINKNKLAGTVRLDRKSSRGLLHHLAIVLFVSGAAMQTQAFDFSSDNDRTEPVVNTAPSSSALSESERSSERSTEKPTVERPVEYPAHFSETDFVSKPYMNDFRYVVVVNKANHGREAQSIKVYERGQRLHLATIVSYLENLNQFERDSNKYEERRNRIYELASKTQGRGDALFKVSTGRDAFEKEGEHHSQKDSWSVTPTGYFTPQFFEVKHKSESYSNSLCDSWLAKGIGFLARKEFCTMMENAIFFNGPIALHKAIPGTEPELGVKASGGCVRLPAALAEYLFLNIGATRQKGSKIPLVNKDGSANYDSSGNLKYIETVSSIWGRKMVASALIIVVDDVL